MRSAHAEITVQCVAIWMCTVVAVNFAVGRFCGIHVSMK